MRPRESIRSIIIDHIDELSDREIVAVGRWLASIERGRQRQGLSADESDADLADSMSASATSGTAIKISAIHARQFSSRTRLFDIGFHP